jgi:hypothetical protein
MKTYIKNLTPEEIIKRLKNGEIVKIENSKEYFKMIDGVVCRFFDYGDIGIGSVLFKEPDDVYFETEEPFEIKETGFYMTRACAKVYVNSIDENRKKVIGGVIEWEDKYFYWNKNGVYCSGREDAKDIIGKWKD